MQYLELDIAQFRERFPEFADPVKYPDELIESWWERAICIISNANVGCLSGDCRLEAIYLLMAHIGHLADNGGDPAGFDTSATIDKVSVGRATPFFDNELSYWLMTTSYGLELLALLGSRPKVWLVGGSQQNRIFRTQVGAWRRTVR